MGIHISEEIDAPVEACWDFVGDFGHLGRWLPGLKSCVMNGEGVGAVRTLTNDKFSFDERLEAYDAAKHTLTYAILPGTPEMDHLVGMKVTIRLTPTADGRTQAEWLIDIPEGHPNAQAMFDMASGAYPRRLATLRQFATGAA